MAPDNAAASPEGPGRESWIFVGERRVPAIAPDDRTLAYGDGLFETMRACRGEVAWWDAHWSRLERGAARLRLAMPSPAKARSEATQLLDGRDGVLKLQLGRGSGGRGYAPPLAPEPTWILSRHPLPSLHPVAGVTLRWCDTRLALQPALAGIKHCNRLEQVLARAEWQIPGAIDGDADEGVMCTTDGDVVCATAANLFVLHGERWRTPPVDRCGVAGVCRQWLLDRFEVEQVRLSVADVETADAIVLTNAVRGILPVARLGSRRWAAHPRVAEWRRCLAEANPAFAVPGADPSNPPEMP